MVASEASNRSRDKGAFYASQSSRLPTPVGLKVTDRRVVICILDDARARASIDRYDGVYRAIIARSGCLPVSSYPFVVPVDFSSLPFHRCDINTRRVRRSSPTRVTSCDFRLLTRSTRSPSIESFSRRHFETTGSFRFGEFIDRVRSLPAVWRSIRRSWIFQRST